MNGNSNSNETRAYNDRKEKEIAVMEAQRAASQGNYRDRGEISVSLDGMSGHLDVLSESLSELEGRLEPVCEPNAFMNEAKCGESVDVEPETSKMHSLLKGFNERIVALRTRVDRLRSRLQL